MHAIPIQTSGEPFLVDAVSGQGLKRAPETLIDRDLIAIRQTIGLISHADHC
jgi:hypothetical protein